MNTFVTIFLSVIVLAGMFMCWCLCAAGAKADEEMERLFREGEKG